MRKPPNVLLIFMDDMVHRAIGCLNNPEVRTPNLDRLVRRGTAFTHAFNQGSWEPAVCVPARAMLLSGLTLFRAKERFAAVPHLGETFTRAGYDTFFTGKWHNGEAALRRSYARVGPTGPGMYPSTGVEGDAYRRPSPGNRWDPADTARAGHWLKGEGAAAAAASVAQHSSVRWADAAVAFLKGRDSRPGAPPFFLHVAFHAPHDPRQAPREYLDMYPPGRIAVPPNFLPEHPFDQGDARVRDELLAPFPRTPDAVRLHRREYYAILTHADAQIGRILDALDAAGEADDTVIAFSGDHGLALGEHGLLGKQNLYDHSVRVPLVLAGPGVPADRRVAALVYQSSLFPTLCALAGVPAPPTVEARDLSPLLLLARSEGGGGGGAVGSAGGGYDAVFGAYRDLQRMVRTERHKLIVYPKLGREQLFDVASDPWEARDLAADPATAPLRDALRARLRRWQRELGDPLPL